MKRPQHLCELQVIPVKKLHVLRHISFYLTVRDRTIHLYNHVKNSYLLSFLLQDNLFLQCNAVFLKLISSL